MMVASIETTPGLWATVKGSNASFASERADHADDLCSPKSVRQFVAIAGGHSMLQTKPGDYLIAYARSPK